MGSKRHLDRQAERQSSPRVGPALRDLQLERGSNSNTLTDDLLGDLGVTISDCHNRTSVLVLCFLASKFPDQLLIILHGCKQVLAPAHDELAWFSARGRRLS